MDSKLVGEPMRGINKLAARTVETIKEPGRYSDGGGLYLLVRQRGGTLERLWVYRYKRGSRDEASERTISLGPSRDVSLAKARELAGKCRAAALAGEDPKTAVRSAVEQIPTFGEVADALIADVEKGFKSVVTRKNWRRTLGDLYCAAIRRKAVDAISTADVIDTVKPIWSSKPETARKVLQRIERVLDAAKASGLRNGDNPARWKGHMKLLLPARTVRKGHYRSLPYRELPAFMVGLSALDSVSALALEWTILTAARTSETLGATRTEVDRHAAVWVVPAHRMKENREHRVPLCGRCIEIFDEIKAFGSTLLFPSRSPRRPLSNMAMAECLRRLDVDATVHGFRSTFRTWVQEETVFADWMAESALSHLSGDAVERAYKRGDAIKRRREMMLAWETYCRADLAKR